VPQPDPSVRKHDGFFLRLGLGLGFGAVNADTNDSDVELSMRGAATAPELLLGGTPAEGLVIGSGFIVSSIANPAIELTGREPGDGDSEFALVTFPIFANYYFDPHEGLHVQGLIGFGAGEASVGGARSADLSGLVIGLGLGWEWWVGEQWSIGAMARISYASVQYDQPEDRGAIGGLEESYDLWLPSIGFIATLH
jgi:hypothetical protein